MRPTIAARTPRRVTAGGSALLIMLGLLLSACRIQPPVSIGQRESKMGQGIIVLVTNTSEKPLREVRIRIAGPEGGEAKEYFEPTLAPRQVLEVGWLKLEGWPIPPGAEVEVTVEGYALGAKASL